MKKFAFLALALFLICTNSAHAYIDPGSGSALMSVIIGFFVAIGVLIKTFWYKIKSFLGLSKSEKKNPSNNDAAQTSAKGQKNK